MIEPTSRGKEQSWEQEYIERIKNLKSGSRERLELLTVIAETEAQKRYKRVCNVINKYAKTMKEKYRPAVMYVISNLCMHENVKVRKLYKSRFEREISVIVEKICECRVEQLSVVKRNIERWREREVFEASILDECEYHVQRFEEAAQQAGTENNDNDDNDDDDDGGEIIGRFGRGDENATTPEPGSEEEITLNTDNGVEEKKKEETKAVIINKWPKMLQNLAVGGGSVQKKKTKPKKNRNKNNNNMNDVKMLVNNSFRQQNQHQQQQQQQQQQQHHRQQQQQHHHHQQRQQQRQQQSSHGQGKAPKKVSQREQNKRANNKKEQQNKQRTGQGAPAKPVSERLTN
jgi:hypothetical protein